jgi:hypothetical protein
LEFPGFLPRPPRLSPPQADDGGQVESLEKYPKNPVKKFILN